MPAEEPRSAAGLRTRLLALATLIAFASLVTLVAHEAYRALTDSFVAPIIMSPDSELVLQNKLKTGSLHGERAKAVTERDVLAGEIEAGELASVRLRDLLQAGGHGARRALEDKRTALEQMARRQRHLLEAAEANLAARLITTTQLAEERQALAQIEVALIENSRVLAETWLAREDRHARVEIELIRLESELRSKRAQRSVVEQKLAMLDELETQLRERPAFQAMDRNLEVAFVPYSQIEGVAADHEVYECVWGLLFCEPVGRVEAVVPGEVVLADPWGNPARGLYAVLDLWDPEAARSKSLRVRASAGRTPPPDIASR
jgi:hypothetical protein